MVFTLFQYVSNIFPLVFHNFLSFWNMCMADARGCCDAAVSTCSAARVAQCRVWFQHVVFVAQHVSKLFAHMVSKPAAGIISNVYLSACHAIMLCRTLRRGPVSAKKKPATIMPNPYRVHSPPPSFNVALLSPQPGSQRTRGQHLLLGAGVGFDSCVNL